MLITIDKDILVSVLEDQIKNWEEIGGGANYDAFEFDPKKVNKQQLSDLGFYQNRDSWIAGVQIQKAQQYLNQIIETPKIKI